MGQLAEGVNAFQKGLYGEAYTQLLPYAEQGEVRAQLILARLFYAGHGVERSEERYLYWLRRSADSGDKAAKSLLKRLERGDVQPPFELLGHHVAAYRLFGYLHIPRFYISEVMSMSRRFNAAGAVSVEQGDDTGEAARSWLEDVAQGDRLVAIVNRLLGRGYQRAACQEHRVTDAGGYRYGSYHATKAGEAGLQAIACLDRGGAVQLFAGSHKIRDAFARQLRAAVDSAATGKDHEAGAVLVQGEACASKLCLQPGDLLLCDLNLVHRFATSAGELRVIGIEYTVPQTLWRRLGEWF